MLAVFKSILCKLLQVQRLQIIWCHSVALLQTTKESSCDINCQQITNIIWAWNILMLCFLTFLCDFILAKALLRS